MTTWTLPRQFWILKHSYEFYYHMFGLVKAKYSGWVMFSFDCNNEPLIEAAKMFPNGLTSTDFAVTIFLKLIGLNFATDDTDEVTAGIIASAIQILMPDSEESRNCRAVGGVTAREMTNRQAVAEVKAKESISGDLLVTTDVLPKPSAEITAQCLQDLLKLGMPKRRYSIANQYRNRFNQMIRSFLNSFANLENLTAEYKEKYDAPTYAEACAYFGNGKQLPHNEPFLAVADLFIARFSCGIFMSQYAAFFYTPYDPEGLEPHGIATYLNEDHIKIKGIKPPRFEPKKRLPDKSYERYTMEEVWTFMQFHTCVLTRSCIFPIAHSELLMTYLDEGLKYYLDWVCIGYDIYPCTKHGSFILQHLTIAWFFSVVKNDPDMLHHSMNLDWENRDNFSLNESLPSSLAAVLP